MPLSNLNKHNSDDDWMSRWYLLHLWFHLHPQLYDHSPRSSHHLSPPYRVPKCPGGHQLCYGGERCSRSGAVMWKESSERLGIAGLGGLCSSPQKEHTGHKQQPLWVSACSALTVLCTNLNHKYRNNLHNYHLLSAENTSQVREVVKKMIEQTSTREIKDSTLPGKQALQPWIWGAHCWDGEELTMALDGSFSSFWGKISGTEDL